jgi:hypothetical protein
MASLDPSTQRDNESARTPPAAVAPAQGATRGDRVRDVVAIVLVLAGAGLIGLAHVGNTRLATQPIVVAPGQSAFSQWMHYYYIEFAGYGAVVAGVLVGLASYVIHARRAHRARVRDAGVT